MVKKKGLKSSILSFVSGRSNLKSSVISIKTKHDKREKDKIKKSMRGKKKGQIDSSESEEDDIAKYMVDGAIIDTKGTGKFISG